MCVYAALPKEYERIGRAFRNLSTVFISSKYPGEETRGVLLLFADVVVLVVSIKFLCLRRGDVDRRSDSCWKNLRGDSRDSCTAGT